MEFTKSTRGALKLLFEGYAYTKKKESKTTVTWECAQRRSASCKGAVITDNPPTEVRSAREHCHERDNFNIQAIKVRKEIMECVEANRGQPGQIIADKLVSQAVEVRVATGLTDTLKRNIRRKRAGHSPNNPLTLAEIPAEIPEPYSTNMIYDNGSADNRIMVFASEDRLRLLQDASSWFMDGTHSTAPQQFKQVFTVRVKLGETSATAVYALLPSKRQEVYEECLTATLDACLERDIRPNPYRIVADFEMAIHNAVRTVLSSSMHIQGCFYHLTQSTWRHLQGDGLQRLYRDDPDIRHYVGMLDGLAFLPPDMVKEGMAHLKQLTPDSLRSVTEYFDSTYVNGGFRSVVTQTGGLKFSRCSRSALGMSMKQQSTEKPGPTTCASLGITGSVLWLDI